MYGDNVLMNKSAIFVGSSRNYRAKGCDVAWSGRLTARFRDVTEMLLLLKLLAAFCHKVFTNKKQSEI